MIKTKQRCILRDNLFQFEKQIQICFIDLVCIFTAINILVAYCNFTCSSPVAALSGVGKFSTQNSKETFYGKKFTLMILYWPLLQVLRGKTLIK